MKKTNQLGKILLMSFLVGLVLQSCASRNKKYGCPERIETASVLTLLLPY